MSVRVKRSLLALILIWASPLIIPPAEAAAALPHDPTLFGAWKWSSSQGGLTGWVAKTAPRCSLVLYIHRDGTFARWERDSLGDNLLCYGTFKIKRRSKWPGFPRATDVEFKGWPGREHQLITFQGSDEFSTYPGGYRTGRAFVGPPQDAGSNTYVRVTMEGEPRMTRAARESRSRLRHEPILTFPDGRVLKTGGHPPAKPDSAR